MLDPHKALKKNDRKGGLYLSAGRKTHVFLGIKVGVVMSHVLRGPVLDQAATQKPNCQTTHEHADVGDEHSDAISRVSSHHTGDVQKGV